MKKINFSILFFFITVLGICILLFYDNKDKNLNSKTNNNIDEIKETNINDEIPIQYAGELELPIIGASGYASIDLELKNGVSDTSNTIKILNAGTGFTIINETNEWWKVKIDNEIGYVKHKYCFINLPDVIPSIIYDITNSYSSIMQSSGQSIDNVTGAQLYNTYFYNERLNKYEYVAPVLYAMAKKIALAQKYALQNNDTLIIYESFRPYEVQRKVVDNLKNLASINPEVMNGITAAPWAMSWFISTGTSNHQKGLAIDVSLGKIINKDIKIMDNYNYINITDYEEYEMPTKMHELSINSIRFVSPVASHSKNTWKNATFSDKMKNNVPAKNLQFYATNAGLTPLASEWWHYNDLDCLNNENSNGNFYIYNVYSTISSNLS